MSKDKPIHVLQIITSMSIGGAEKVHLDIISNESNRINSHLFVLTSKKEMLAKQNITIPITLFNIIDECLEGVSRLMKSNYKKPLNIGSDEMININSLAEMTISISGKKLTIKNIDGPVGVNGRCSDNQLITKILDWHPRYPLKKGIEILYNWVNSQLEV